MTNFTPPGKTLKHEATESGLGDGENVELTVKPDGTVVAKGNFRNAEVTSGKSAWYTPSGSSVLEAWGAPSEEDFIGLIHLYFAPNAKSGFTSGWCGAVTLP